MTDKKRRELLHPFSCFWTLQRLNMFSLTWIILMTILGITNADTELFSCDFESQCSRLNQERTNDEFDWSLHNGATDQWFTGPNSDHTNGDDTGHYFYAKSDINFVETTAQLFTPFFDLRRNTVRLEFYYHMYDARYPDNMGTLNVYAHPCGTEQLVFSRTGNQGFLWKKAEVELQCEGRVQIAFEAVRGGTESDIAIDDVSVIDVFDNTSPGPTGDAPPALVTVTEGPITATLPPRTRTARPPIGMVTGSTDPIKWPTGTHPPESSVTTASPPTPEHVLTTKESGDADEKSEPPKSMPTPRDAKTEFSRSEPTTTESTAIWGPPSKTLGDTAIIGAAIAVGVMCVLILILIVLVWKTRRGKNDDAKRGEVYQNQAFTRSHSQDIHQHCHLNDPAYTALNFPRGISNASTLAAAPEPPKRRLSNGKGKYIGLRGKPGHYSDSSLTKHPLGISTISTTRSATSSNEFGCCAVEGHCLGVYEAVPVKGKMRRSGKGRRSSERSPRRAAGRGMPRRCRSDMLGNPMYIGGSEGDLQLRSTSCKLPTGPLEPKYYTVLPDVVDTLHYKVRVSKLQTLPSHARTWHVADHYPHHASTSAASLSEDSDIEPGGSKESVYADIEETRSSLSDYSVHDAEETTPDRPNIYGSYEIEC